MVTESNDHIFLFKNGFRKRCYKETPLFHGIKSCCFNSVAFVNSVPLAILIICSRSKSPNVSMSWFSVIIEPQLKSIISGIFSAKLVLLETLITGVIGFPVGVPNPVVNNAKIQFISGTSETVIFKVYNLLGEEVDLQIIHSQRGVNTINLNTTSYSEGMYLYSINNGKEILTKRMIIKN